MTGHCQNIRIRLMTQYFSRIWINWVNITRKTIDNDVFKQHMTCFFRISGSPNYCNRTGLKNRSDIIDWFLFPTGVIFGIRFFFK